MPAASRLPNGSAQPDRDPEPGPREGEERSRHERRSDEPELLADDREDHVRVRLGQEVDLLDALTRAPSPVMPPEPMPIIACTDWNPAPSGSFHGSRKLSSRARR